ncbi:5-methyltetrahydrofolate--homocysteine methyltransferase [Desulfonispora thiosulfatigenes DSM 11270]|uniref:Methionine synthase n=1 Tax=Desulfonispora thiosulfatigenes DSM 11270 TaxID=656914 RepID=A0A1W1V0F4_DESTI|nr:homocysteine S-methyltransferase family protein [Desulfonispora thiosulfatigenes]SMB86776.1 5-methyltetrahydrofolate--homocysteine methyltransferase [Desulfonispora thiosulfatigenes DSM 11270]
MENILKKVLVFDGAMGTLLQEKGLTPGACPELMNKEEPKKVREVHKAYVDAGADVVTTNTFGGNRIKLSEYGLENEVAEINQRGVEVAKGINDGKYFVAGSVGPTGRFLEPLGDMTFDEAYDVFKEQINALAKGGADFIIFETFHDLGEVRAGLLAAKDVCSLPVICSLTYDGGRTLTGVTPRSAAIILESLGADAIGANCSGGPEELYPVIEEITRTTSLPVIVEPNAGLPEMKEGKVYYPLDPQLFIEKMVPFFNLGMNIFGSCCGSSPLHTKNLKQKIKNITILARNVERRSTLASREQVIFLGEDTLPKIIGERINPTARKKIAQGLKEGNYGIIQEEGAIQVEAGADLLDVNVGTPGIDEKETMSKVINLLQQNISIPLVIDSTNHLVLENALKNYQGKALVNSINGEQESLNKILPLVKRYGAGVIALVLDENGIPETAQERKKIAHKICKSCEDYGISKKDIYIDCLALTIGTDDNSAKETLETIKLVKQNLGVNTILGVSNVSHGLPSRSKINSAFLAMAIASGLDVAIINPLDKNMLTSLEAASFLAGRDPKGNNYIKKNSLEVKEVEINASIPSLELVTNQVIKGSQGIRGTITALLQEKVTPIEIINQGLIPGLNIVGEKFGKGEYYLPQLMLSAETSQKAFDLLEKEMDGKFDSIQKETIIIGTVKGDVHDIGKNMVGVMLKNHGFRVIDLGKNIETEDFYKACEKEKASFVGLSALMTTTMMEIPKTIDYLKERLPNIKVIIGGAVINEDFAKESGADGYAKDAVSAVQILESLRGSK